MLLKTIIFVFAITFVVAEYADSNNEFNFDKASDGLGIICESKKPVRVGCRECSCSNDGYEITCKVIEDCSEEISPSLVSPRSVESLPDATPISSPPLSDSKDDMKNAQQEKIICEPNSFFSEYCNHCACSENGKMKSCTVKFCPPGVYTKEGYLNKENDLLQNNNDQMFFANGTRQEMDKSKYTIEKTDLRKK